MHPLLWSIKPWRTLAAVSMAFLILSCKHEPKQPQDPVAPSPAAESSDTPKPLEDSVLVADGESSQPSYSSTGDRLLFVSARRVGHIHPQIYERNLKKNTERRITFQNGSTASPRYDLNNLSIVYSSSTDELKEFPPLLNLDQLPINKMPAPYSEPMDIYTHSMDGLEIKRITHRSGFDGEARFAPDGKTLTWTRVTREKMEIMSLPPSKVVGQPVLGLGPNPTNYVLSSDGKAKAWVEWEPQFAASKLFVRHEKKKWEVASQTTAIKTDTSFSPDSKWLVWAQKDLHTNLHSLWVLDLNQHCETELHFSSEGDRRHPVFSPDMKFITYTLINRGRSRIAQAPFAIKAGACVNTP